MKADIYKKQAKIYTDFANESFSWKYIEKPSLERHLKKYLKPGAKILDAGCGSGRVIRYLISKDTKQKNITGVDINKEMLQIARNDFRAVRLINSGISNAKFKDSSFDMIISTMVIHYLDNQKLAKSLSNFYKWSKNTGIIFILITHPVRLAATDLRQYFRRGWKLEKTPWGTVNPNFIRTVSDYINAIIKAKFQIVCVDEPEISGITKKNTADFKKYASWPSRLVIVAKKVKTK